MNTDAAKAYANECAARRRADLKSRGYCINGKNHPRPISGVRCDACKAVHRGKIKIAKGAILTEREAAALKTREHEAEVKQERRRVAKEKNLCCSCGINQVSHGFRSCTECIARGRAVLHEIDPELFCVECAAYAFHRDDCGTLPERGPSVLPMSCDEERAA